MFAVPLFKLLIDMAAGGVEPGIIAIFAAVPDRYGPVIPGPLRKKPLLQTEIETIL